MIESALVRKLNRFLPLSQDELAAVAGLEARARRVPAGTELVREGDPGDFFCLLVEGEARVTKNRKLLSVLGPGECFGEMALLHAAPRSATVTAETDMRVVVLDSREFSTLLEKVPAVARNVLAAVAERLRETEGKQPHH